MIKLVGLMALLHASFTRAHDDLQRAARGRRDERGSVTIEHVMWAVAVIIFVGVVVAAITAYINKQAGSIK